GEPFSQLDILPKNRQPITTWDNQDEAFREIAESVRETAMKIRSDLSKQSNSQTPWFCAYSQYNTHYPYTEAHVMTM
ncbi:MAG: hypothetical protein ACFB4J_11780, partial [Elainellaceae cyanobacterium]